MQNANNFQANNGGIPRSGCAEVQFSEKPGFSASKIMEFDSKGELICGLPTEERMPSSLSALLWNRENVPSERERSFSLKFCCGTEIFRRGKRRMERSGEREKRPFPLGLLTADGRSLEKG